MGFVNQPLTNEAAKKLMALDVQDKEILTYEKAGRVVHRMGRTVLRQFLRRQGQHGAGVSGGAVPVELQDTAVGAELGVCEHWVGISRDTEVRE